MNRRNSKFYSLVLIAVDTLVLIVAFVAAYLIRTQYDDRPLLTDVYGYEYLFAFLTIVPFWIAIFGIIGLYQPKTYNKRLLEWSKIAIGSFIGILLVIGWEYVSDETLFPARLVAAYAFVGSFVLIALEREVMRLVRTISFRYGKGVQRVLLIGSSVVVSDIAKSIADTKRSGYQIVGIAGPKKITQSVDNTILHFSTPEAALKMIETLNISLIIQTDLYENPQRNRHILSTAQSRHIEYSFIPGESAFYSGKNTIDVFVGYPVITVHQTPLMGWGAIVKRIFDFVVTLLLLLLLSPLFLVITLLQLIFNPGPVFYKSQRLTRYSQPFAMYKFRSMSNKYGKQSALKDFEDMGRQDLVEEYKRDFKVENDPRITRFGHFLRQSSIDELPQLINVLKGDLSLVGPRPIPQSELDAKFSSKHGALLLSVKSGITGLWQVSGRSETSTEQRMRIELFYAENWSFWLDMKILVKTIWVVLRGKGAH